MGNLFLFFISFNVEAIKFGNYIYWWKMSEGNQTRLYEKKMKNKPKNLPYETKRFYKKLIKNKSKNITR